MIDLPFIMVAPNGAYKQKSDHANLPVSISEIAQTAVDCAHAGANGIHVHVRNSASQHCLDAGLYKEIINELSRTTPELLVQITTEAVNIYTPEQQRQMVYDVVPLAVSVALKEMLSDNNQIQTSRFYHWANDKGIDLQHILYSEEDVTQLNQLIEKQVIPRALTSSLYVLGRYADKQQSSPADLIPFLNTKKQCKHLQSSRFMVCAFGIEETNCLTHAAQHGGHCRIGFENNLLQSDGTIAMSNAQRVEELVTRLKRTTTA